MSCPLTAEATTIRLTKVDGCGRPICAVDSGYVFDCFSTLAMATNSTEGTDVEYKSASGRQCGFKKGCPTFNGYDVTLNFFSLSPQFIDITTGNPLVYSFDNKPIGFDDCQVACNSGFALEIWTEVISDECAVGAQGTWMYFLLPWISNGLLGDIELGAEAVDLTLTGATRAGGKWGVGPYNVVATDAANTPGTMLTPLGSACHRRVFQTTIAPPAATCEYAPVAGGVCLTPVP